MDNPGLLSNSRRVPPLPRGTAIPSPVTNNREARPSIQQLNSIGIVRNASQTSLHSESGRRRHTETPLMQRQLSREHYDSLNPLTPGADYYRTATGLSVTQPGDGDMANELLKIAREQNQNLKDQNMFLLTKIREITSREKQYKDTLGHYELMLAQITDENEELRKENEYLKKEVSELTDDAKLKMEEFGAKLALLIKQRKSIETNDRHIRSDGCEMINLQSNQPSDRPSLPSQQMFPTINSNVDGGWQGLHQYISNNQLNRSKPDLSAANDSKADKSDNLMQDLNNQFQALIYSCRVQKNPEKRKQIRKRLVDLTYKMRALGSK